jgi:hypothetical protein
VEWRASELAASSFAARKAGSEVGRRSFGQTAEMAAGGLPTICNAEPRKAVCDCDAVSSARGCAEGFGLEGEKGLRAWFQHGLSSDLAVVSERGEVVDR